MKQIKQIDHIAIATHNLDESVKFYTESLGLTCSGIEVLADRGIRVAFLDIGESRLELMEPIREDSEISGFLNKKGPGIHHIAMRTHDIVQQISSLTSNNIKLTGTVYETGAHNTKVAFIHPKSSGGVLIELVEK